MRKFLKRVLLEKMKWWNSQNFQSTHNNSHCCKVGNSKLFGKFCGFLRIKTEVQFQITLYIISHVTQLTKGTRAASAKEIGGEK